jgi:hypothetical protein
MPADASEGHCRYIQLGSALERIPEAKHQHCVVEVSRGVELQE